jgi:hypothetical protein
MTNDTDTVVRLFHGEVPEVADGTIEVKAIARATLRTGLSVLLCLLFSCAHKDSSSQEQPIMNEQILWPPLPTKGFIKGRAATKDDLAQGNAAFLLADDSGARRAEPIDIEIPQYCFHNNAETN